MTIDRQQILGLLRDRGDEQQVAQAERALPEQVDPERDADLLERLGLDPQDLIARFPGGRGLPGL
jgi:hypothetical protein